MQFGMWLARFRATLLFRNAGPRFASGRLCVN